MEFIKNIRIGRRLTMGFGILLAMLLIVGGVGAMGVSRVHDATTDLANNWLLATRSLGDYEAALSNIRRGEALTLLAKSAEDVDQQARRILDSKAKAAEAWKRYAATIDPGEEQKIAKAVVAAQDAYYADLDRALSVSKSGDRVAAEDMFRNATRKSFDATIEAINADVEFQSAGGVRAYEDSSKAYNRTWATMVIVALSAALVTVAIAWLLSTSIVRPINAAVKIAETVASGDLSSEIEADSLDEAGQLLRALKNMNGALVTIVSRVRDSSDSIATGSAQIAAGNADLSQRTEAQASNLQQTAASMEELTATVKQNAETAKQASALAGSAAEAAEQGGSVVGRVVATMREINESSTRIADIIGVVDGIAFQTNILALNAAVEAARAGEQGRGFAVVAGEVRSLAQRSAQAAREVKGLIATSVEKVEAGSTLVDDAGRSMGAIVSQVKRVTGLISEISTSSDEQSRGIGQVGEAIVQLDQVTQQNAALVEQSAAAAESLKQQSERLSDAVAGFRL
ncbi:methyl-accepting chemotaxis protein [Pelomonas sp. KK5]|uniref:methyl-accepting chemotaxis protein n=1 Tax=Pelomonas sp. KK5 TaxID=1855730 RepID=UPI00097C758C|nr:methyl-accepting chemotaxis protein [Pelomonas sp. KK5]